MTKSTKAALLSTLVFPGSGHLYLKKHLIGAIIVLVSIVSGYYLMSIVVENTLAITQKIQTGEIQPDAVSISKMMEENSKNSDNAFSGLATIAIFFCWIFGIIDSVRIGHKMEKSRLEKT